MHLPANDRTWSARKIFFGEAQIDMPTPNFPRPVNIGSTNIGSTRLHTDAVSVPPRVLPTQRFVTDARASRFTVKALASGMSAGLGHSPTIIIRDFMGEGEFTTESLERAHFNMRIQAGSLRVEDEMRDDDRCMLERIMRDQVLLTDEFPEITFESSTISPKRENESVYQVMMGGKLTLRDITRKIGFISLVTVGAYNLRANGTFEIRQSDFGIRPVAIAG